jgi:hypothetical protein
MEVSFYISACSCFFLLTSFILISNIAYKTGNLTSNKLLADFVMAVSKADDRLISSLELAEIKDKFVNITLMINKKNI